MARAELSGILAHRFARLLAAVAVVGVISGGIALAANPPAATPPAPAAADPAAADPAAAAPAAAPDAPPADAGPKTEPLPVDDGKPFVPEEAPAADAEGGGGGDTCGGGDPSKEVPAARWRDVASGDVASMRAAMTQAIEEVTEARSSRDAVRQLCVNENVTQMKGMLQVAESASVALQQAVAQNDQLEAKNQFRKVATAKCRMDESLKETMSCAGAEATDSTASVQLTVDDAVANVDPYYGNGSFFFNPSSTLVTGGSSNVGGQDPTQPRPPPASGTI